MTEWWTYRPSDFLLFSARTYRRLFELVNADAWPVQLVALTLGLLLVAALWQRREGAQRAACLVLGAAWLHVAWAFHWQRFAAINWAATWFAVAFVVQGLLWWAGAASQRPASLPPGPCQRAGAALLLVALCGPPALGLLLGRPLAQVEVFGIAPDPTVLGSLAVLLAAPGGRALPSWLLWPIPLLWCAVSGLMLATMQSPEAWLLPLAAALALAGTVLGSDGTRG